MTDRRRASTFKRMTEAQENLKRLHARDQEARERALLEALGPTPTDQNDYVLRTAKSEVDVWNHGFRKVRNG